MFSMTTVWRSMLIAALALVSQLASAKNPGGELAKATLTTTVTSAMCVVFVPGGSSSQVPCSASGWDVTLSPGQVAQMFVSFNYTYTDDGLSFSNGMADVQCNGVPCNFPIPDSGVEYGELRAGVDGLTYPIYLPLSAGADSFSSSTSLVHTTAYGTTQTQTLHLEFATNAVTVSAVTPVPEPATWLLMALALPLAFGLRAKSARR